MKPERTEDILRSYADRIPDDPLFDERADRQIRAELQACAREEEDLRSSAHLVRGYRQRETIHRGVIAVLAVTAASLLFALVVPHFGSNDDGPRPGEVDRLMVEGDRAFDMGSYAAAEESFRAALGKLVDARESGSATNDKAREAAILRRLGDTHRAQGQTYQAELFYAEALGLRMPAFPDGYLDVAMMLDYLGSQAVKRGDFETARDHFERMSTLFGPTRRTESNRTFFEETYALASDRQVDLARRLSETGPSAEHYRRYVEFQESLSPDASPRPLHLANLAEAYRNLAEVNVEARNLTVADDYYAKALQAHEQLNEIDPDNIEYLRELSEILQPMAEVARQRSDFVRCRGYLDRSRDIQLRLLEGNRQDRDLNRSLGDVYGYRAQLAMQLNEMDEAREEARKSVRIFEDLVREQPLTEDLESLALAYAQAALIAQLDADDPAALEHHQRVAEVTKRLSAANPDNPRYVETIATTHTKIGEILASQGRLQGAIREFGRYVTLYQELSAQDPRNKRYFEHLSIGYSRLADLYRQESDANQAREHAQRAVDTYEWLVEESPDNPIYRDLLLRSYDLAGELTIEDGRWKSASEYFRALAELRESALGKEDALTARARARQAEAIVADDTTQREQLVEAETLLRDAARIFRADGNAQWERDALETLARLYGKERLDYPRKLSEIERRLGR